MKAIHVAKLVLVSGLISVLHTNVKACNSVYVETINISSQSATGYVNLGGNTDLSAIFSGIPSGTTAILAPITVYNPRNQYAAHADLTLKNGKSMKCGTTISGFTNPGPACIDPKAILTITDKDCQLVQVTSF